MARLHHAGTGISLLLITLCWLMPFRICAEEPAQRPYNHGVGKLDWPQLGGTPHRNNTPNGQNIPSEWNVETGKNIKWSAKLGNQTFGNIVVANGKVYVGTNNGGAYIPRYPWNERIQLDLGVLLCFRESDGEFLWQYSSEKLPQGRVHDWPLQGICSAPVVEGDRLWFVTNRGEVACVDANGFYDNEDDGPLTSVWSRAFEIVTDFRHFAEGIAKSERRYEYINTLDPMLRDAGLSSLYNMVPGGEPNEWFTIVGSQDPTKLLRVTLNASTLTILGLGKNTGKQVQIDLNPTAELAKGRLPPLLRAHFKSRGVDVPNDIALNTLAAGKTWAITLSSNGKPVEYQLDLKGSRLTCHQKITPVLKHEADVVWSFDMMHELGVRQHNLATCAPTIWGDVLFVCTSNGLDETHLHIPAPQAPSFIAMDKHTGKVLWTDNSPGKNILHGQWSCPVVGVLGGVPQVIFPGGDGWIRSFRADRWNEDGTPIFLWKFDGNPKDSKWLLGGRGTRNNIVSVPIIYDGWVYVGLGQDPEHGEGEGNLWCIDPTKRGDVSPDLVVDDNCQPVPHRRVRAIEPWREIFDTIPDEVLWADLKVGPLAESVRKQFQQAGVLLPESCTIKHLNPGGWPAQSRTKWLVEVHTEGDQRQFTLEKRIKYLPLPAPRNEEIHLWAAESSAEILVPNPNSAAVWHYASCDQNGDGKLEFEEVMHRTLSSPTIKNDLLFIADFSGLVHCLNAKTGKLYWTYDEFAAGWSTPLIVGDKVYIGDEDGDVAIFALSTDLKESLRKTDTYAGPIQMPPEINMGNAVYTMPVVANDVLYIAAKNRLFAIENGHAPALDRGTPAP